MLAELTDLDRSLIEALSARYTRGGVVHIYDVQKSGLTALSAGQVIEYQLYEDHRGQSQAQNLKIVAAEPR